MIEVNISCPNVKEGGVAFGVSCEGAAGITKIVRAATKTVIMKLTKCDRYSIYRESC